MEVAALDDVRAAIVHDWFQGYHGAERTVDVIRKDVFSSANAPDIFTFTVNSRVIPSELEEAVMRQSRLAKLPGLRGDKPTAGRWRYLLPIMPRYFRSLDLRDYDLVIASSHSCAVHAQPPETSLFVCYCYTPMRYAWLPSVDRRRMGLPRHSGTGFVTNWLRRIDYSASRRPDAYIAISEAVRERIRRFYGREAFVIHPPVETTEFVANRAKDPESFLWVHRLVSYKRPELVVEAFRGLPYKLTMVGVGPLEAQIRGELPPNVELRGWLDRRSLVRLYEEAGGFIHVAEEDFGISMVEALASGTPVISLRDGAGGEIVREGQDGYLLDQPSVTSLREAVTRMAQHSWSRDSLTHRARDFSRERFVYAMRDQLAALLETKRKVGRARIDL